MGMVLAALFFIYRVSSLTTIEPVSESSLPPGTTIPEGTVAYRIFGSLFFGAVGKLETLIEPGGDEVPPRVMILDLHKVINIDTTGMDTLGVLRKTIARRGGTLVLCDVNDQPLSLIRRSGFLAKLGADNLQPDLPAALARAQVLSKAA